MSTRRHPLEPFVWEALRKYGEVDVLLVAAELGTCTHPERGVSAYRLVAADVLECMTKAGRLRRQPSGRGNPRRPEDGGFWYTAAEPGEPSE